MSKIITAVIVLFIILGAVSGYYFFKSKPVTPTILPVATTTTPTLINSVKYVCQNSYSINADYYENGLAPVVDANTPPTPTGSVELTLSDGRNISLPQTISASGVRYANAGEAFVFWTKGNGVTVYENTIEKDFIGCVQTTSDTTSAALPAVYVDTAAQFSVRLPSLASTTSLGFVAKSNYTAEAASGTTAAGVKFTIPAAIATGTNLSADSFISIEKLAVPECAGSAFGDEFGTSTTQTSVEGTEYSVASSSDAGAGNRYEETLYALSGTSPCIAVRYFIHYTVLENYASGTVTAFDRASILTLFNQIRQSLVVNL
jgi:membrane-bound inhibitor of C-type lysozyme